MSKSATVKDSPKIKGREKQKSSAARPNDGNESDGESVVDGVDRDDPGNDDSSGSDAVSDQSTDDPAGRDQPPLGHGLPSTWQRPFGDDPAAYEGWAHWSRGQWAWEFLRRNDEFQRGCQDETHDSGTLAARFHLKRFKHFGDQYAQERKAAFRVGIRSFPRSKTFVKRLKAGKHDPEHFTTLLTSTEVLLKFQLAPTKRALNTSIARQCRQAEEKLQALAALLRAHKNADEELGSGVHEFVRKDLLKALRALDMNVTKEGLISIGSSLSSRPSILGKEASDSARRAVNAGKEFRNGRYLLVAFAKLKS